jgi:uncharacterized protein YdbL (DUF1318 family)
MNAPFHLPLTGTRPAGTETPDTEMDQVRELLIGGYKRDTERQMRDLSALIAATEARLMHRLDALEADVNAKLQTLVGEMTAGDAVVMAASTDRLMALADSIEAGRRAAMDAFSHSVGALKGHAQSIANP